MSAARAYTRTTTGDFMALQTGSGAIGRIVGARLTAASANATAQITDGNGNVLLNLAAVICTVDESVLTVQFEGKVSLAMVTGAGASVSVYVE